jgi:hypothetical protein
VARQVECDGFVDILEEEIEQLTDDYRETLTNEELQELRRSSTEDEADDYEQKEPGIWNMHEFAEVFQTAKNFNYLISDCDHFIKRSIKITHSITDVLKLYGMWVFKFTVFLFSLLSLF